MKKKPAPQPDVEERERDNELPEGWAQTSLSEICDINPPKPAIHALRPDAPVTFVPMPAVDAKLGAITVADTRPFSEVRKGYTAFQEGDVIMAKITPCMENGKAAIARHLHNRLGFGSTEFHVLRPRDRVLGDFVYHFIRQASYRKAAESEMTGSVGQKRVPADFIESTIIPLAPYEEQRRITKTLTELITKNRTTRGRLERVPRILKTFRQSVLAAACSGRLTEDWSQAHGELEWEDRKIGDFCLDSFYGPRFGRDEYTAEGIPTIRTTDFTDDGRISLKDPPRISIPEAKKEKFLLKPDDLLVTRTGSIGKMAIFRESYPALPSAYLIRFRFSREILVDFVFVWLMSPRGQELLGLNSTAVTQPNINAESIRELPVPFPSITEQHEIVRRVDALFNLANAIEKRVEAATKRADRLTQSILAKAFRGEIVPTEAELARRERRTYEPASALLARIRAEREKSTITINHPR